MFAAYTRLGLWHTRDMIVVGYEASVTTRGVRPFIARVATGWEVADVMQVDGLIDGQQFEAVIGGGKGHSAEQFKPCRCMAAQNITLMAIRCPNSPL